MDHTEAVRLQAAEKYALRELTPELMNEYEEHYFDCAECAMDVKAVMAFADASCQVFREQESAAGAKETTPFFDRWFGWLRPAFAVPVLAALLLFIGYQNTVTIPAARQHSPEASIQKAPLVAATQAYASSFALHGSGRGERHDQQGDENADRVSVHSGQTFDVKFDFLPAHPFDHYIGRLQDEAGRTVFEISIAGELAGKEVHVPIPAGSVNPGKYKLVIAGDPAATGQFQPEKEVAHFAFVVEFLP